MAITARRQFLGAMLASAGLCLDPDKSPLVEVDQYFDRIQGVRCVPVGRYFNYIKPFMRDDEHRIEQMACDQLPICYSEQAIKDAIATLPAKFPVYGSYHDRKVTERTEDGFIHGKIPQYHVTNVRIDSYRGERWLVTDILCAREDLPPELSHLTAQRTKEIIEYMALHKVPGWTGEPLTWPNYWGTSGMGVDFWPYGKGTADLTGRGLLVKTFEFTNFGMLAAAPFSDPTHLRFVWWGQHSGHRGLSCDHPKYIRDHAHDEWGPHMQLSRHMIDLLRSRCSTREFAQSAYYRYDYNNQYHST